MRLFKKDGQAYIADGNKKIPVSNIREAVEAMGGDVECSSYRKVILFHDEIEMQENPLENTNIKVYHRENRNFCVGGDLDDIGGVEGIKEEHPDSEIVPLYAYVHSGVSFSVSNAGYPFNCPWDAGAVGYIVGPDMDTINSALELLNHYAQGNCFGYKIENEWGEKIDSNWGFWGYYDKDEIRESIMEHCPDPDNMEVVFHCNFSNKEEKVDW